MALIACPECTKQISTHAAACPHCGYPMQATATIQTKPASPQLRNCPDCGGDGKEQEDCYSCGGSGQEECHHCMHGSVRSAYDSERWVDCNKCSGTGYVQCTSCAGRGYDIGKCSTCRGSGQLTVEHFDALQRKRAEAAKREAEAEAQRKAEEAAQAKLRAEIEAKRKAEEHAQWLADAPKRAAEEAKRKAEEAAQAKLRAEAEAKLKAEEETRKEAQRREQEKKAEEERVKLQEARISVGCCINCGGALGFLESLSGRQQHPTCPTYEPIRPYEGYTMTLCKVCRCATRKVRKQFEGPMTYYMADACAKCGRRY